jgi:hypothetical protein
MLIISNEYAAPNNFQLTIKIIDKGMFIIAAENVIVITIHVFFVKNIWLAWILYKPLKPAAKVAGIINSLVFLYISPKSHPTEIYPRIEKVAVTPIIIP